LRAYIYKMCNCDKACNHPPEYAELTPVQSVSEQSIQSSQSIQTSQSTNEENCKNKEHHRKTFEAEMLKFDTQNLDKTGRHSTSI
jgi:hypothetical protein